MQNKKIHIRPESLKPLIHEDRVFKSANDFSVTEEVLDKARVELKETDDVRARSMQELKERIRNDSAVKYNTDESYLLRYLRYTKYDVEKAHKFLRKLYFLRQGYPSAFSLSNIERLLNARFYKHLPYMDEQNCIVTLIEIGKWNIDEWSVWDVLSLTHALNDLISLNPNTQIHGIKSIFDVRDLSLKHLAHVANPRTAILVAKFLQEIYPWRINKIFVIHNSSIIPAAYKASNYLVKKKMRDRVVLLESEELEQLHEHIHPAILPKEHGGYLEENGDHAANHVMDNMDYIKFERAFGPTTQRKSSSLNVG